MDVQRSGTPARAPSPGTLAISRAPAAFSDARAALHDSTEQVASGVAMTW
jgi:hypothetical protein